MSCTASKIISSKVLCTAEFHDVTMEEIAALKEYLAYFRKMKAGGR